MKYKKGFLEYFEKFPIFTFSDANMFLSKQGASQDYARKLISIMLKRGELQRVTKGHYTTKKDMDVIGYAFKPFYYGLGFALSYHGLSSQGYNLTVMTTKTVRSGVRRIFGTNVVIQRIPKELFLGYEDMTTQTFHFYISDIEKTLLDMLYFDFVVEDYVYVNTFKRINKAKIKRYLKRFSKRVTKRYSELEGRFGTRRNGKQGIS